MNELKGRYVNVVLGVEEGKNMDFVKRPLQIIANFNGRVLESDPAQPEDCPAFNTELVWEIEKKDLRKIRSSNAPLRVECCVADKSHTKKEKIGYILMYARCAPIIAGENKKKEIPYKWYKLMGVAFEHRPCHPELYLSLTIRDAVEDMEAGDSCVESSMEDLDPETRQFIDNEFGSKIPISYLEDGYIQVGKEGDQMKKFHLYIIIEVASNLDILLPEVLVFSRNKDKKYHISFSLFGITIKSKPFQKNLHNNIELNEKIVISLMSNFETLKEFFTEHHKILVYFQTGTDKLGMTKINVEKLIGTITEEEFLNEHNGRTALEEQCNFCFPSPNGIVPESVNGRKPLIQVKTVLEQSKKAPRTLETTQAAGEEVSCELTVAVSPRKTVHAAGDNENELQINLGEFQLTMKSDMKAQSTPDVSPKRDSKSITKSTDNVIKDIPYISPSQSVEEITLPSEGDSEPLTYYHQFCVTLILEKIMLKTPIKMKSLHAQFRHPKAATFVVLKQEMANYTGDHIFLNDMKCKMFFTSTPSRIRRLLYAWPPKLVLMNDDGKPASVPVNIRTSMFLNTENNELRYSEKIDSREDGEYIASVSIFMHLQEYGLGSTPRLSRFDLWPSVIDEKITINAIKDLEEWKNREKENFKREYDQAVEQRVSEMEKLYQERREELQKKVDKNVKRCKILIQQLKASANNIRIRNALEKMKKDQTQQFEDELSKNMQIYGGLEYRELVVKICSLERDNENLKDMIREQADKIECYEKSALTKEQTATLLKELRVLEEQFEEAQKQKSYFKDQWKRAVQEIHELRTEDQKQLLSQIQMNKEELSQLSLTNDYYEDLENDGDEEISCASEDLTMRNKE